MYRRTQQLLVVVHQHSIEQHGEIGGLHDRVAIHLRCLKDNVVGLPLARLARGIREWWPLAVNRSELSIRIRRIIPAVENLHLIAALQEDSAVAAILTGAADHFRIGEYH